MSTLALQVTSGITPLVANEAERKQDAQLSQRDRAAVQGTLLLTESGRLELGDNILLTLYVCLQPL